MLDVHYDVIVVGAGHAGVEAALISHKLGSKTLLITNDITKAGVMSCNPSIGGLGKGHIVKELDLLGGVMGKITDQAVIQYKKLNVGKGPAVRGSRAQCDKWIYAARVQTLLKQKLGRNFIQGDVLKLIIKNHRVTGVVLANGVKINSKIVIITAGTFMRGVLHIGNKRIEGGRHGEKPSVGLSDQFKDLGALVFRLKTGTPPRLLKSSINWSILESEKGDDVYENFHFMNNTGFPNKRVSCGITHTNEKTHEIIRKNLNQSPLFTGALKGVGPRYCPSVEDKIVRFADKDRHQTFLEPEGLNVDSVYLQGISTSLPEEVQVEFLQTIKGLENVKMIRPGYAVEYDFIEPTQLNYSLETKFLEGLFLAGQVNGTSGYEEAACQGLLAGVNAHLKLGNKEPLILPRYGAYMGVLVDDLILKGTKEPYRMLTSRAEYRLLLREDNTFERLFETSKAFGLLSLEEERYIEGILFRRKKVTEELNTIKLSPTEKTNALLKKIFSKPLKKQITMSTLLKRSEVKIGNLLEFGLMDEDYDKILYPVEVSSKYEGYINNELKRIKKTQKLEALKIPRNFDYGQLAGLSTEEIEKLTAIAPLNLAQAKQISGVNPSAIQYIAIHLSK